MGCTRSCLIEKEEMERNQVVMDLIILGPHLLNTHSVTKLHAQPLISIS